MNRFTRFVLDLTSDWETRTHLHQLAKEREFVHIVMDSNLVSNVDDWSLPGLPHPSLVAQNTNTVIDWLDILKTGMCIEYTTESAQFARELQAVSNAELGFIVGIPYIYENILSQVGRIIKPLGLPWQIIYGNGDEIELFMRALAAKHISGKGWGFLLIGDSFPYLLSTDPEKVALYSGLLYIIESGLEDAKSAAEISELRIVNTIMRIAQTYKSCGNDGKFSANCLKTQFKATYYDTLERLVAEFGLFNSQNGQLVKIFDIGAEVYIDENLKILYPGNTEKRPQNESASIEFAYLGGHLNNPIPFDFIAQAIHIGGQVAYSEISASELILPNYRFKSNLVEIGGSQLNMDAIDPFLQSATGLGHAYVGGFSHNFATAFQEIEEQNPQILKPKLYSNVFHSNFTDPHAYPYFNRISISNQNLAVIFQRTMSIFNWRKFIYISSDLPALMDLQKHVAKVLGYGYFDAVLLENYSNLADLSNFDVDYVDLIDRIIETKVRIIVAQDYDSEKSFKLFEALYKRGYKPGDFIPIYNSQFFDLQLLKDKYPENFENTMKFFHGGVTFSQERFMGEIGENLAIQYQEILGQEAPLLAGSCFEYDAMYTLAYSYDTALSRGQDYEITEKLNNELRAQRFTGCSGYVSFQMHTNDRNFPAYAMYQSEYKNGSIQQLKFGNFDPLDPNIASINRNFFWADGSTSIPSDEFQESWDCPFADDEIQTTPLGQKITIAICYSIFGISIVIAVFIWRKFWNVKILPLTKRMEFSQADLLLTATLLIEFSQNITTGPDFSDYAYGLSVIANAISADIEEILDLKNGLFWILVDICISLTGVIMILYLFKVTQLESRFPNNYFLGGFRTISDSILPILDDILFLPIIQIYLEVFVCIETHGNDRYDMFLHQDCYVNCWTGTHLSKAIIAGVCVAVYIPVAIYLRPQWQENEHELNVISEPFYLMVKSVFQIMIVALNKTLGRIRPQAFGWLYIIVFFVYFIFLCKQKPFNYNRFCLWERLSMLGVIWITGISSIHVQIEDKSHNLTLVTCLFVGWALLVLLGWYIQFKYRNSSYPSLLYFHKSENYADLVRFQFRDNTAASITKERLVVKLALQQKVREAMAKRASALHQVHRRDGILCQRNSSLDTNIAVSTAVKNILSNYNFSSDDQTKAEMLYDRFQNDDPSAEQYHDPIAAMNSFNDDDSPDISGVAINPQDGQCVYDQSSEERKIRHDSFSEITRRN